MKATTLSKLNVAIFSSLLILGAGCASKQAVSETSHEAHHPEAPASEKSGEGHGMMGQMDMSKMDMGKMKEMMQGCMAMHKDGKMCEHQSMEQCQANMAKGECDKMMKTVKQNQKKNKSTK